MAYLLFGVAANLTFQAMQLSALAVAGCILVEGTGITKFATTITAGLVEI